MKLLFILDSVEFPLAPNPVLARRVAGLLAQRGHEVHLLELWDGETPAPREKGCTAHPLSFADERIMNRILENGNKRGTPVPLRLLKLCGHPAAAWAAVRQLILKKPRRVQDTIKAIERLDRQYHFDAAVSVAAPYASSFALAAANISCKKASWQMDPYAASQGYSAPGAWQKEAWLLSCMDRIFVAPSIAVYYKQGKPLEAFASKMRVLDFPALVSAHSSSEPPHDGLFKCVFVGSLYPEIRTPFYALDLFSAANLNDAELIFVGGGWENYPHNVLTSCQNILGSRLTITGPLPKAQADEWLQKADILVSLGNSVDNQVPSKLFEYFAAGKPILHLAKLDNDPCLPYLARWPLALVLTESKGITPEICQKLGTFLSQKGHSRLPFDSASDLFFENTPTYAADRLEDWFKE